MDINNSTIEKAIKNASVSVEMEGFVVTNKDKELCKKLLSKNITWAEYLKAVAPQRV
jgi:hypothetical protein